jgi:hypothetical protein
VTEECKAELGLAADSAQTLVGCPGSLTDGVGAEVGELFGLQVPPHLLDGVEIVAVGGELFDQEPGTLSREPLFSSFGCGARAARPRSR